MFCANDTAIALWQPIASIGKTRFSKLCEPSVNESEPFRRQPLATGEHGRAPAATYPANGSQSGYGHRTESTPHRRRRAEREPTRSTQLRVALGVAAATRPLSTAQLSFNNTNVPGILEERSRR